LTIIHVHDGAYVDGNGFEAPYTKTKACGDKAYFRKPILDVLKNDQVEAIIPVSETVYKVDESKYSYNKDSDQWFCNQGNYTTTRKKDTRKDDRQFLEYKFEKETCRLCSNREACMKGSKFIARKLAIGINTPEFYEYSQRAKAPDFLEKYKKRASHEWKNAEMKRFHGMDRARGYGLKNLRIQAKLTALAVNLKRIAGLLSSSFNCFYYFHLNILVFDK
jgi:hypothetical protein